MAARRSPRTFDQVYRGMQRALGQRAKVVAKKVAAEGRKQAARQKMVNELELLAVRADSLLEAGNENEARKLFRRALFLEKKLGISSRKSKGVLAGRRRAR
jgi:phage shock protein A